MPNHQWTITEGNGPAIRRRPRADYDALWNDLLLRLEVTPAHKSVNVHGEDRRDAKCILVALTRKAGKLGAEVVRVSINGTQVIVQRGPNWSKRGAGELAHIGAHPADAPGSYKPPQNGKGKGRPRQVREV